MVSKKVCDAHRRCGAGYWRSPVTSTLDVEGDDLHGDRITLSLPRLPWRPKGRASDTVCSWCCDGGLEIGMQDAVMGKGRVDVRALAWSLLRESKSL